MAWAWWSADPPGAVGIPVGSDEPALGDGDLHVELVGHGAGRLDLVRVEREDVVFPHEPRRGRLQALLGVAHERAVAQDECQVAPHTILLVALLARAVDRDAEDRQPRSDEALGRRLVEPQAEVRAEERGDAALVRVADHLVDVLHQQRLAPVAELDLPQRVAQLVEQPPVVLHRHAGLGAAGLTQPGEACRAAQVADVPWLDRELDGQRRKPGRESSVGPPGAVQVHEALRSDLGAGVVRQVEQAPRGVGETPQLQLERRGRPPPHRTQHPLPGACPRRYRRRGFGHGKDRTAKCVGAKGSASAGRLGVSALLAERCHGVLAAARQVGGVRVHACPDLLPVPDRLGAEPPDVLAARAPIEARSSRAAPTAFPPLGDGLLARSGVSPWHAL